MGTYPTLENPTRDHWYPWRRFLIIAPFLAVDPYQFPSLSLSLILYGALCGATGLETVHMAGFRLSVWSVFHAGMVGPRTYSGWLLLMGGSLATGFRTKNYCPTVV